MDALLYRVAGEGVSDAVDADVLALSTVPTAAALLNGSLPQSAYRPYLRGTRDSVNATATSYATSCPSSHVPSLPEYFAGE